jgi:enoyl-CoA hydratase/carnithine racemase
VFAQDAYRVGLANHVVTREELLPAAKAMAVVMCARRTSSACD